MNKTRASRLLIPLALWKDKVTEAPQGRKTIRVSKYKLVPQ